MNRQEKSTVVEKLRHDLENSQAVFVVSYKGLTVSLVQSLRKELRKHDGAFKVAKGRLMKRATQGLSDFEQLEPYFKEQIGLVFAEKNSPAVAKVIADFSKENASLQIIVGCLDAKLLDSQSVARVASLPSREVLLAHLCGTLQAPMTQLARVLDQLSKKLVAEAEQAGEQQQ
jgi:large subunit ribosomal protein L10